MNMLMAHDFSDDFSDDVSARNNQHLPTRFAAVVEAEKHDITL